MVFKTFPSVLVIRKPMRSVGNILRTLLHTNPPQDMNTADALVDYALATASHALHSTLSGADAIYA